MPPKRIVEFEFPLPRTHAGIALGNGTFGALVWGVDQLHVTVNRSDFWDHRGAEYLQEGVSYRRLLAAYDPDEPAKVQEVFQQARTPVPPGVRYPSRMPMGRFELALGRGFRPRRGILDATTGVLRVQVVRRRESREISVALHPSRPLLQVGAPAGTIATVRPRPAWEWLGEEMAKYRFAPPVLLDADDGVGWAQECPDDPAMAAVARSAGSDLMIAMCPGKSAAEAIATARAEIHRAPSRRAFLAETRAWWQAYWKDKPVLRLPSPFFATFVDYALFRFAGATSPHGVLPSALQGPWVEEYQFPPWSGDYTVNENIQQIYTLAFPAGAVEHLVPLFDWLDSLRGVMQRNAKVLLGIDDGLLLTHSVDDRGAVLQGGLSTMGSLDQGCLGWLARLYWLYYRHTGDTEFLRRRALPFMRGVMRVYEAMLEPDGDHLSLKLSVSPEFGQPLPCSDPNRYYSRLVRNGTNASFQLACIHMLADMLLQASADLGQAPAAAWATIRQKVPPYTLVGAAHNRRIGLWEGQDLTVPHRHHSHLAAIYPFDTLCEPNAEQQAIVENSIDHWVNMGLGDASEWSLPWSAIILARCGCAEAAYLHLEIWRTLFVNEGLCSVYIPRHWGISLHVRKKLFADGLRISPWGRSISYTAAGREKCEIMQLDGTMGAATAVYEMLVHSRGDLVRVFPAVPERWREVAFQGIHVPGGFRIDGRRAGGRVRAVSVHSRRGGRIRLDVCGHDHMRLTRGRDVSLVAMPCVLDLQANERVRLTPGIAPRRP